MKHVKLKIYFYLFLFGIASNNLQLKAQSIVINTNDLGPVVEDEMFGSNLVYTWNNFNQLDAVENQTNFSVIRFPGGSVTESYFNLDNPNQYLQPHNNSYNVPSSKRISRFIQKVNQRNYTAVFVLPTKRFVNNEGQAQTKIRSYVSKVLNGDYGSIENGRTVHFEVGNEFFWGNQITGNQYAKVAIAVIKGIKQGINDSNNSGNYNIQISVQSGVTDQQASQVADYFKNKPERHDVDFLTWHWYPGRTEIQLGMWQMYQKNQLLRDRLQDIKDEWAVAGMGNLPFFISEFNIKNTSNNNHDHGLRNPMGIMSIFAESVRANATMATIWPVISGNSLRTRYFNSNHTPTFNGIYYKWMEENLRNKRIINGIQNNTYTNNSSNFRNNGAYVEAFMSNNGGEVVIFVHETKHNQRQFRIDLQGFRITSRTAKVLYTDGNEESHSSTPKTQNRYPSVWNNGRNITFTSNKSSKYEVIKIVLKGYRISSVNNPISTDRGIENSTLTNDKLIIYPNPASSDFIYIDTKQHISAVTVFDISGVLRTRQTFDDYYSRRVNISELEKGIYIMQIETLAGNIISKSIVRE